MINLTLIREMREEARIEGVDNPAPILQAITDLLHEVEKTPWRVRGLIGTGSLLTEWQTETPLMRLCHLVSKVGQLSSSIAHNDRMLVELTLSEIAAICIDWINEKGYTPHWETE